MSDGEQGRLTTSAAGGTDGPLPVGSEPAVRFPCFDGLRALGVVTVIASHVGFVTGATAQTRWGDYLAHLDVAPAMFFFISAFLLYRTFVASNFAGKSPIPAGVFWWRRLLRVFPAYWLALTVLMLFFGLHISGRRDIVVYYLLLQIYDTHRFLGGIPQAWTLCVELSFYVFLPPYAWLLRRLERGRDDITRLQIEVASAALLVAFCFVYRAAVYKLDGRHAVGRIAVHWLPGYLDVFALGIALAAISAYVSVHGTTSLVDLVGRLTWLWCTLALVCFWLVVKHLGLPRSPQPQSTPIGWQADEQEILQTLFAGFIALPAIFGPQDRGYVRRFLSSRPIAYAGLVSYGFYLWHEGWLDKWLVWAGRPNVLQLNAQTHYDRTTYPLIFVLTVVSSLATAAASYYLVDRPVLRLKNRVPRLFAGRGTRA